MNLLCDSEDIEFLSMFKWRLFTSKGVAYLIATVGGKRTFLHRLLVPCLPGECVDHINGDTLDNRRKNLRTCTQGQNCKNKAKRKGSSGSVYIGVTWDKRKRRFISSCSSNGRRFYLGRFKSEAQAALTYNIFASFAQDSFARLNNMKEAK